jgi:hypothetical protein
VRASRRAKNWLQALTMGIVTAVLVEVDQESCGLLARPAPHLGVR